MYSDTAGLSYEDPEIPAGTAHHQGPDLNRAVSYPDAPESAGAPAGDPAGPHETTAVLDPDSAGIDELLNSESLDNAAPLGDGAAPDGSPFPSDSAFPNDSAFPSDSAYFDDSASFDDSPFPLDPADSGGDEDPAPGSPARQAVPGRPQVNPRIASAPRPVEAESPAETTRPFGAISGEGTGAVPAGGGQRGRQRVLEFATDARMKFWRERVVIMIAVGVLFGIVGNWIVGLTLAIIAGIAHAIWRSRSVAAIAPGTKLDKAQRITQRKLARMERAGYLSLHTRPIPDSEETIDHLVVGPTGVYAIDSEKWNKKLPIRTRNGKQLWLGPESKKPRLEHARWEAQKASELLSARLGREVVVRPALAVYGPHIPWDIAVIREVDVFNGDRLRQYLKKRSKVREVRKLSRDEVARVFEAAEAVLPAAGAAQEAAPVG
jgi:hypothetical protein